MNYRSADTALYHKGHGGKMDERKVANNTYLIRHRNGDIGLVYHYTEVITFHQDDTVTLRNGGWWTSTTKERLNYCDGITVYSEDHTWSVVVGGPGRDRWKRGIVHEFQDGMRIDLDSGWLVETIETYA